MAGSGERSDQHLLQSIARGEERALEILYQEHAGRLFALSLQLTRDRQAAEEVIQDVFVRVWRLAGRYDPSRGGVFNWLLVMTRSRCIDHLRASGRGITEQAFRGGSEEEIPSTGLGVSEQVETLLDRQQLLRVMASLPDEQRLLLEAAFFEGWSHSQLAERYGLPLGTVKSRLRRGMERLRDGLTGGEGEPSSAVR